MSALEKAPMRAEPDGIESATDVKFCGVDDPTCEACQ
jgi:hypothetical protein